MPNYFFSTVLGFALGIPEPPIKIDSAEGSKRYCKHRPCPWSSFRVSHGNDISATPSSKDHDLASASSTCAVRVLFSKPSDLNVARVHLNELLEAAAGLVHLVLLERFVVKARGQAWFLPKSLLADSTSRKGGDY